ncbi:MAG TPA: hypothetical protein VGQ09_04165 [Chitinophagaceae bacterium]|jgi:hypothetical protein|nr:hypothetical protein [Chitinophagaceae bacterium]
MKKQILTLLMAVILCSFTATCSAQEEQENYYTPTTPKWISVKGYWTIESNIKTPKNSIIYFYNNENNLVYKEKIEGMKINLKRRKVLMHLKNVLEQSVIAWEKQHILKQDEMLVATALKK